MRDCGSATTRRSPNSPRRSGCVAAACLRQSFACEWPPAAPRAQVLEEKAAIIAELSVTARTLEVNVAQLREEKASWTAERELLVTRSLEAMQLADRRAAEQDARILELREQLAQARGEADAAERRAAALAVERDVLQGDLQATRAELGEAAADRDTCAATAERLGAQLADLQALEPSLAQARRDAARLVQLLSRSREYQRFMALAFPLPPGRGHGGDGAGVHDREFSSFVGGGGGGAGSRSGPAAGRSRDVHTAAGGDAALAWSDVAWLTGRYPAYLVGRGATGERPLHGGADRENPDAEGTRWLPEAALAVVVEWRRRHEQASQGVTDGEMMALLHALHTVYHRRAARAVAEVETRYKRELEGLRRRVSFAVPYREVMQASTIARLTTQLHVIKTGGVAGEAAEAGDAVPWVGGIASRWAAPAVGTGTSSRAARSLTPPARERAIAAAAVPPPVAARGPLPLPAAPRGAVEAASVARHRAASAPRVRFNEATAAGEFPPTSSSPSTRPRAASLPADDSTVASRGRAQPTPATPASSGLHRRLQPASPASLSLGGSRMLPSAAAATTVSLLSVPGSGAQRLDAAEAAAFLEEALAAVDLLRQQVRTSALQREEAQARCAGLEAQLIASQQALAACRQRVQQLSEERGGGGTGMHPAAATSTTGATVSAEAALPHATLRQLCAAVTAFLTHLRGQVEVGTGTLRQLATSLAALRGIAGSDDVADPAAHVQAALTACEALSTALSMIWRSAGPMAAATAAATAVAHPADPAIA